MPEMQKLVGENAIQHLQWFAVQLTLLLHEKASFWTLLDIGTKSSPSHEWLSKSQNLAGLSAICDF